MLIGSERSPEPDRQPDQEAVGTGPGVDGGGGLSTATRPLGGPGPGVPTSSSRGQLVLHPPRGEYHAMAADLLEDGFDMASDLCAVDYLAHPTRPLPPGVAPERFEVVVNLLALEQRRRVRVRVQVPDADPVVDSLSDLYPGTEAMEREAYDLFGIRFDGHPDLTRILLPEGWEGHPLRKDYSVGRVPVQFKEAPGPR
ncbi:MAG: NADH-quinone oxidoreductase subunit C [Acidimicrobiales bacterium]